MKDSFKIILVGESRVGCNQLSHITSGYPFNEGESFILSHKFSTKTISNKK